MCENMENRRGPLNRRIKRYSILRQLNFGDNSCSKYWLSHVIHIFVSHISQALPQQGIDLHPCNQHPCSRLRDPVSWRWNGGETVVASSSGFLELHIWSLINLLFFFETFFCCYSIWARWRFLCRCGPNWEYKETSRLHKGNTSRVVV